MTSALATLVGVWAVGEEVGSNDYCGDRWWHTCLVSSTALASGTYT